jgi:carboxymethylenebutenolidase
MAKRDAGRMLLRAVGTMTLFGAALLAASVAAVADDPAGDAFLADSGPARVREAPLDPRPPSAKFWWSDDWFERGQIEVASNHTVVERAVSYVNAQDGTEVPARLFRPAGDGRYPAVLFAHGRRGLDDVTAKLPLRLAARGFVVLAPDTHTARFIEAMPVGYDAVTESDIGAGIEHLLTLPDVSTSKVCVASHTRGGYTTLRTAVAQNRQGRQIACYLAYYPHWQNPTAGEPDQVYRYAPELDRLSIPVLVMMGEYEQYQRRRSIETAVAAMKARGADARLIIYPGVGRGFDFRGPNARTFADDLASKDSLVRAATFLRAHLQPHGR